MRRTLAFALAACVLAQVVYSVPEGDEEFDTQTSGYFYVFADQVRLPDQYARDG